MTKYHNNKTTHKSSNYTSCCARHICTRAYSCDDEWQQRQWVYCTQCL